MLEECSSFGIKKLKDNFKNHIQYLKSEKEYLVRTDLRFEVKKYCNSHVRNLLNFEY